MAIIVQAGELGKPCDAIGAEPEIGGMTERLRARRPNIRKCRLAAKITKIAISEPTVSGHNCRRSAAAPPPAPARRSLRGAHSRSAAATGLTVRPGVRRAGASGFPNRPQGRTISTAAITRRYQDDGDLRKKSECRRR